MMKHALPAVIGLLGCCLPLLAQDEVITGDQLEQTGEVDLGPALTLYRPDIFSTVDGAVLIHELRVLTLLDGRRFPISNSLGRMGMTPVDFFPVAFLQSVDVQPVNGSPRYGSDAVGGVLNLHLNRVQTGGEVGVFYGKSSGKFEREDFETHIIGSLATDKFQITAGAAYQESSGRINRPSR